MMGVERRREQTLGGEWEGKLGLLIGRGFPSGIQPEGHLQLLAQIEAHWEKEGQARGRREEVRGKEGRGGTGVRGSRVKYGDIILAAVSLK